MTGNDVIEEALRLLLGTQHEELNRLDSNIDNSQTTISFTYNLGGILPNTVLDIDLETLRVWAIDVGSGTATVQRGMYGTTAAAHSGGALVNVNPRMSRFGIFRAINDELNALSSVGNGLFQIKSYEFTYQGAVTDYDLGDSNVMDIYDVRMWEPGPSQDWLSLPNWRFKPKSDTSFVSGNVLHLPGGWPGRTIEVIYKTGFTQLANATDDLFSVGGLPVEAQDIVPLGVLLRLGPAREIARNFTEAQGDTRRATEVPPNAVANSFNAMRVQYTQRIAQEAARLHQKYPVRHR